MQWGYSKPGSLIVRTFYEGNFKVTDVPYSGKDIGGYFFSMPGRRVRCILVVGGDFSVSSAISHRALVKSSACRLPVLIF